MGTVPPTYVHVFPPNDGVAAVNVTPTIDEALAAVSNEHTSTVDEAPLPALAALIAVPVPALPEPTEVDALDDATDVVDLLEHAVTDTARSIRVTAVNIVGNLMKSQSFQAWHQSPLPQKADHSAVTPG